MPKAYVRPYDLIEFRLDTTGLRSGLVPVDEGLRHALPKKLNVAFLTFVSLSHDIAIDVEYNRKDGVLYAPGFQEFFKTILEDDRKGGRQTIKKPYLYIGKAVNVRDAYIVATRDEIAAAVGVDPARVDDYIRFSQFSWLMRRRRHRKDVPEHREDVPERDASGDLHRAEGGPLHRAERDKTGVERDLTGAEKGLPRVKGGFARAFARAERTLPQEGDELARDIIKAQLLSIPDDVVIPVDRESIDLILGRLEAGRFDSLEGADVHEQALILSASPGFDRLISLDAVRNIVPFAYQVGAVKEVLRRMRGRAILADEVGLGKTIEAGLIMMEYILRGLAKRVLILCPPPLMSQWMDEMRSKFNMDFVASDDPSFTRLDNPWLKIDRIIASIDTAKREPHSKLVQSAPFDLVIVDEAHRCRNKNTLNWKLVNGLKKKYILLLTATPVQNDLQELFNLITLLRPGQLETASDFSRRFITRGDRLKPKNVAELRMLMREVMIRNRRETCGIQLPRRRAETVRVSLSPGEAEFYSRVSEFVRSQYGVAVDKAGRNSTNDKGATGSINKVAAGATGAAGATRFTLKTLQKEAGSSTFAALPTLRRMRESGHFAGCREDLERLIDIGQAVESSAKAEALLKLLQATSDKVLVFTGYTATLEFLARFLERAGVSFATFSGEMTRLEKERSIEAFKEGAVQVLLSTESGGEGRNLQFCHVMVNFDLPWNPMKIEQRIGRIHRIGQEHDVFVFNLSAARTLEAHILDLLDAKINMFELVVGELDMILGNIEEEEDFEDTIMDLWAGARTEEELRERFDNLGEQLARAKAQYDRAKEYEDVIFGSELGSGGNKANGRV
ncbi:MAG TPA: DEAD/DEAH box helicase family protein [Firmicutes bacterium]|nr:DEAD/DEAH box helicase family protein [Bacillota bacterium]